MRSKKLVRVVTERLCCEHEDMRSIPGTRFRDGVPMDVFCVHCKQRYRYVRYTDVAGSGDWRYDPVE